MSYELPTLDPRKKVKLVQEGIQGLIPGEVLPWADENGKPMLTKVEADEDRVTFYTLVHKPFVVRIDKDNASQLGNLQGMIEKYLIGNDIAKWDKKAGKELPMPEFDFERIDHLQKAGLPNLSPL